MIDQGISYSRPSELYSHTPRHPSFVESSFSMLSNLNFCELIRENTNSVLRYFGLEVRPPKDLCHAVESP
jgi:hypothetical protein